MVAMAAALLMSSVGGWVGVTSTARAQRRAHVVRPGDTLARIARRYHVSVSALQRANHMRGTTVRQGRRLAIPPREGWRRSRGRRYRVRPGDTLARIARRFHVSVEAIQAANRMRGTALRPGDELVVPRPGQSGSALGALLHEGNAPTVPNPEVDEAIAEEAEARAQELQIGPTFVGQRLLRSSPEQSWRDAAGTVEDMDGTLLLPVEEGRYLRGWGSGLGGYHLAVDIGAPTGTIVRAAERGLVAYTGHGIRGYGNMIMIVHANGWVTAYAHNHVNLVVPGQIVERGQEIAQVGQTGFARGPHLHFILVFESEHCDATPLFTPRIVRPNGQEPDAPTVVWDTEHRPSGVRCLPRRQRPHPHYSRERRRRRRGR